MGYSTSYSPNPVTAAFLAAVSITITAGNLTGSAAHGLGAIPTGISKPNPDSAAGNNAVASADATNITITLDIAQGVDIIFTVLVVLL